MTSHGRALCTLNYSQLHSINLNDICCFPNKVPEEQRSPGELGDLQADVDMHSKEPGESSTTQGEKRKIDEESSAPSITDEELPRVPLAPATRIPQGRDDSLKWKRQRASGNEAEDIEGTFQTTYLYQGKRILTAKLKKKMLDKEIPYKE